MKTIFWNVDTQKDFMNKDGKLYVQGAEEIKSNLKRLTNLAKTYKIIVVNTGDYHDKTSKEISNAPDFKTTFPPHCMEGSEGYDFIVETYPKDWSAFYWRENVATPILYQTRNIIIFKDHFDVFQGNKHTEEIVKSLKAQHIIVYGVATNVCVDFAVMGLVERGYLVTVVKDAIKGLPNLPVEEIYKRWQENGVSLITTEQLTRNLRWDYEKL